MVSVIQDTVNPLSRTLISEPIDVGACRDATFVHLEMNLTEATVKVHIDRHVPPPRGKKHIPHRVKTHDETGELDLVYFHAKGDCSDNAAGFLASGAHIHAMERPHGLLNPKANETGDLPNGLWDFACASQGWPVFPASGKCSRTGAAG